MKATLIVTFIALAVFASVLSGCSTVAGMGQDIKGAAEWTHEKMTKPVVDPAKPDAKPADATPAK